MLLIVLYRSDRLERMTKMTIKCQEDMCVEGIRSSEALGELEQQKDILV